MKVKNKNLSSESIKGAPIMKKQSGFTLVEVLIAMVIFSVGILGVAAMQVTAIRGNSYSRNLTKAIALAGERMERLMSLDYNDTNLLDGTNDGTGGLDDTDGSGVDETPADQNRTYTNGNNIAYNIYWNVAVNSPVNNTKTIRMIVTWNERGRQRRVCLDFIRAS